MNPFDMVKNLKNIESQMKTMKEELANLEVTGSAGGNMVQVTLNGQFEVKAVKIDHCRRPTRRSDVAGFNRSGPPRRSRQGSGAD